MFGEVDSHAFEAARWDAWHTAMILHQVTQAAFGFPGGLFAFLFIGHIDEEFHDASIFAFGDIIGERVDDDLMGADEGFEINRVFDLTREAGIAPEHEPMRALVGDVIHGDHAVEVITPGSGAAAFGLIDEAMAVDEPVFLAIFFDDFELLVGGAFLFGSATVAAIGVDDGTGREG